MFYILTVVANGAFPFWYEAIMNGCTATFWSCNIQSLRLRWMDECVIVGRVDMMLNTWSVLPMWMLQLTLIPFVLEQTDLMYFWWISIPYNIINPNNCCPVVHAKIITRLEWNYFADLVSFIVRFRFESKFLHGKFSTSNWNKTNNKDLRTWLLDILKQNHQQTCMQL